MNAGLDLSEGNERDESMRQNVLLGTSKIFPFLYSSVRAILCAAGPL